HRITRRKPKASPARAPDVDHFGTAKLRSRLHQGVEHRLQIESRPTDDLQYVGRRSLLLERFRKFVRAIFELVQQSRILNRDCGLRGEVFDKLDLLVRKRANFLTINDYDADQLVVLDHWNCESSSSHGTRERLAAMKFDIVGRSAMHGANTKRIAFS